MSRIVLCLQEIRADPAVARHLLQAGFGGDRWKDKFYVDEWKSQSVLGRRLRYLKVWEIENLGQRFRVVYAHNASTDIIHILGIVPREFDYDPDHSFTKRIVADYDKLGCSDDTV